MNKFLAILTAGLTALTLSFTASAHGPSPQKVVKEVTIKADAEKVWALVGDFSNWQAWHPAIKDTKVEEKDGATYRTLMLQDGGKIVEKLRFAKKMGDKYKIKYEIVEGDAPVADYYAWIDVKGSDGETTVKWTGRFYRVYKLNPPIPEGQDDETALNFVNTVYDTGLANLKKVAESGK